jgi:predicted transposase YdaD
MRCSTQQAPHLWQTIHLAPLPEAVRARLEQILEFWLFERFNTLSAQEIYAMLHTIIPIEETRAYQDILAEGIAKGIAQGETKARAEGKIEGEALLLKRQIIRRFGALPDWAQARIDAAETGQLEAWAKAIFDAQVIEQLLGPTSAP